MEDSGNKKPRVGTIRITPLDKDGNLDDSKQPFEHEFVESEIHSNGNNILLILDFEPVESEE